MFPAGVLPEGEFWKIPLDLLDLIAANEADIGDSSSGERGDGPLEQTAAIDLGITLGCVRRPSSLSNCPSMNSGQAGRVKTRALRLKRAFLHPVDCLSWCPWPFHAPSTHEMPSHIACFGVAVELSRERYQPRLNTEAFCCPTGGGVQPGPDGRVRCNRGGQPALAGAVLFGD